MKPEIPDSDETRQNKMVCLTIIAMTFIIGCSLTSGCLISNYKHIKAIEKGLVEQPLDGGGTVWVEKDQYLPERID